MKAMKSSEANFLENTKSRLHLKLSRNCRRRADLTLSPAAIKNTKVFLDLTHFRLRKLFFYFFIEFVNGSLFILQLL